MTRRHTQRYEWLKSNGGAHADLDSDEAGCRTDPDKTTVDNLDDLPDC